MGAIVLSATYNTPASEWTRAIDFGLAQWSEMVLADAHFHIVINFDSSMSYLARHVMGKSIPLGTVGGRQIILPPASAKLRGYQSSATDFYITINPTHPWHFGSGNPPGKYCAESVMVHEIGHALFMTEKGVDTSNWTPYELWRDVQPAQLFANSQHFAGSSTMMSVSIPKGTRRTITEVDLAAARMCGVPTSGEDRIWLFPGAVVAAKAGDTAVWCGRFDAYSAQVSGPSHIEMPGENALNPRQADIYRLYRAAFGRVPDYAGFRYWVLAGETFERLAAIFEASPEAQAVFAANSHEAYISKLYQNVLGRPGEPAGLAYWNTRTDLNRVQLLCNFALCAENVIGIPTFTL